MIKVVVNKINEAIALKMENYPCLCGAKYFGLTEPIVRRTSDDEVFPVVVDFNGEDKYIFIDDDYPMGIYHRLLLKQYEMPIKKDQYGDQVVQNVEADMILICWAFRETVNTSADVLESIIYSSFSQEIKAVQSNFDRRNVFSGEFSGIPFFLPEDVMLFSMKYKFKYPANARECLNIQNFCN